MRLIYDNRVVYKTDLRHRSERFAGVPECQIYLQDLARFGYAIAFMMALKHANTPLAVQSQSDICAANVVRCRKSQSEVCAVNVAG